jgi:hypothetical protein
MNRGNSQNWNSLFRRWITAEPEATREAPLDLPDRDRRRDVGGSALKALKAADLGKYERLLRERGMEMHEAGFADVEWDKGVPRAPGGRRGMPLPPDPWIRDALRRLNSGSDQAIAIEALRLSVTIRPDRLAAALRDWEQLRQR